MMAKPLMEFDYNKALTENNVFIIIKPNHTLVMSQLVKEIFTLFDTDSMYYARLTLDFHFLREFYSKAENQANFNDMIAYLESGDSIVMMVKYDPAIRCTLKQAKKYIRNKYVQVGTKSHMNMIHLSDDMREAQNEINLFLRYYLLF